MNRREHVTTDGLGRCPCCDAVLVTVSETGADPIVENLEITCGRCGIQVVINYSDGMFDVHEIEQP